MDAAKRAFGEAMISFREFRRSESCVSTSKNACEDTYDAVKVQGRCLRESQRQERKQEQSDANLPRWLTEFSASGTPYVVALAALTHSVIQVHRPKF